VVNTPYRKVGSGAVSTGGVAVVCEKDGGAFGVVL
jgi:hypothetical protein